MRPALDKVGFGLQFGSGMAVDEGDSPVDRLWREYGQTFRDFDDLTLARWCAQTLSQLTGRVWRLSHPLVGAYRLASQHAHDRQIWLKRLVSIPNGYQEAPCCRAPLLPLFSRDIVESGLICQHCGETAVPFEDVGDEALRDRMNRWSERYQVEHQVAHWDDKQRKRVRDYDQAYEDAAQRAEKLLSVAVVELVKPLLEFYPAVVWEDQDECLEVRPEDVDLSARKE